MNACETCRSEFNCSQLATALKIVGGMKDLADHPRLERAHAQLKKRLEDAGWHFPQGDRLCALAGRDAEIVRLTNQLIDAMRAVRKSPSSPSEKTSLASILAEEHWHE